MKKIVHMSNKYNFRRDFLPENRHACENQAVGTLDLYSKKKKKTDKIDDFLFLNPLK